MSREELREVVKTLKDILQPLKDAHGTIVQAYSDSGTIQSSVSKLYEIVVTGNGKEPLLVQLVELRAKLNDLSGEIVGLSSGLQALKGLLDSMKKADEDEKKIRLQMRTSLIIAVVSSIVGPILVLIASVVFAKVRVVK
jgi:hypothetical protein